MSAGLDALERAMPIMTPPDKFRNVDRLGRYVQLEHQRRELEQHLDAVKQEQAGLAEAILDEWADRGQQSANVDGFSLYVRMDFICNKAVGVPTERVCELLQQHGLSQLVAPAYSAASLKAWVKEQIRSGCELPDELSKVLTYQDMPRLIAAKA